MIYWKTIGKFICATNGNVYTVDYQNPALKIMTAVHSFNFSDVLVAANDVSLWVWVNPRNHSNDAHHVYSTAFQLTRTIKFGDTIPTAFRHGMTFALTNSCVASINRRPENNGYVAQIIILTLHMISMKMQDLCACNGSIQIRSDGISQFFITTGQNLVHCVRTYEEKRNELNLNTMVTLYCYT
ncbi:unnamed protein product [Adineta ricciae]|uniref:Uncharacterized protein n=1 Tax=Adineta ricciae TaxID=249248 RepID=A0A815RB74_ADIRI|nr:unnamed protein product [Adineta ricciae]CAF1473530.1 unnamed protein product [Adineta ricciae]